MTHTPAGPQPRVRILGARDRATAFSVINREWHRGLERHGFVMVDDETADVC